MVLVEGGTDGGAKATENSVAWANFVLSRQQKEERLRSMTAHFLFLQKETLSRRE